MNWRSRAGENSIQIRLKLVQINENRIQQLGHNIKKICDNIDIDEQVNQKIEMKLNRNIADTCQYSNKAINNRMPINLDRMNITVN